MAVKRISSDIDVVTAARQRIKNVFSNGVPVYLSFSGGKDSIVLADLTYKLIQAGEINPSQLTVLFVDEEAIFDSIEATTKAWRKKFLLAGRYSVNVVCVPCFHNYHPEHSSIFSPPRQENVAFGRK